MNKAEFIKELSNKTNITQKKAEKITNIYQDIITEQLAKGEKVMFVGFGTFTIKKRTERKGVNPATGKKIIIPSKKLPSFKPGKKLKSVIKQK